MEQLLQKMARQLDSIDEASLMALWEKYAGIVSRFEPTKRWEESALIFAFIQAKRWKNQAFNYNWSLQKKPDASVSQPSFTLERRSQKDAPASQKASVLQFQPHKGSEKPKTGEAKPEGVQAED